MVVRRLYGYCLEFGNMLQNCQESFEHLWIYKSGGYKTNDGHSLSLSTLLKKHYFLYSLESSLQEEILQNLRDCLLCSSVLD